MPPLSAASLALGVAAATALGDGWLPSLGGNFLSPVDVPPMQARIDEGAGRAGRDPASIKRVANVMALDGEPRGWADQLLHAAGLGFEALMVGIPDSDPVNFIRRLGEDVAPEVRERAG